MSFSSNPKIGNKAQGLIALDDLGLTPDFIVIAYDYLIKCTSNSDGTVIKDNELWDKIYEKVLLLGKGPFIVRSSVCGEDSDTASYAGIFLSLKCNNISELKTNVLKIWNSRLNPTADEYKKRISFKNKSDRTTTLEESDLHEMGIIIQKFIEADYGIVMLSGCDKETGFNYIYGEYTKGGIQEIVSGKTHPDYFIFFPDHNTSLFSPGTPKPAFFRALDRVWRFFREIKAYKANTNNYDMEIAIKDEKSYIVQCRPLTAEINPFNRDYALINIDVLSSWKDSCSILKKWLGFGMSYLGLERIEFRIDGKQLCAKGDELMKLMSSLIRLNAHKLLEISKKAACFSDNAYILGLKALSGKINYDTSLQNYYSLYNVFLAITKEFFSFCLEHIINITSNHLGITQFSKKFDRFISFCQNRNLLQSSNYIPPKGICPLKTTGDKALYNWALLSAKFQDRYDTLRKLAFRKKISLKYETLRDYIENCTSKAGTTHPNSKNIRREKNSFIIKGVVASPGEATGSVVVIDSKKVPSFIPKGSIVIANNLMLQHYNSEILKNVAAIAVEVAGICSHPAIIARELGIPCLVDCYGCTDIAKTGDTAYISGDILTIKDAK